jgi:hypothetical protein
LTREHQGMRPCGSRCWGYWKTASDMSSIMLSKSIYISCEAFSCLLVTLHCSLDMYWTVLTGLYQLAASSFCGMKYFQPPPSSDRYYILNKSEPSRHGSTELQYLAVEWVPHTCSRHTVYLVTIFRVEFRTLGHTWELVKTGEEIGMICLKIIFRFRLQGLRKVTNIS